MQIFQNVKSLIHGHILEDTLTTLRIHVEYFTHHHPQHFFEDRPSLPYEVMFKRSATPLP